MKANADYTFTATTKFICPECGSAESEPLSLAERLKRGHGLRHMVTCTRCRSKIPAHLAHRWGGISIEAANEEWREIYRGVFAENGLRSVARPSRKSDSVY